MIRKLSLPVMILLLILVFIGLNLDLLRDTVPKISGRQKLAELVAPVEVLRNPEGIPALHANSTDDVFRGFGYIHAQDRLWQMELLRSVARGKLAEILGPDYLETDQFLLKWHFSQLGQGVYDSLAPESQNLLRNYCEGINAFIQNNLRQLPFEFSELKFKPRKWQPQDCLAIWRLFGWLNSGILREIFQWNLRHSLPKQNLALFEMKAPEKIPDPATQKIVREFCDTCFLTIEIIEKLTGLCLKFDALPDSTTARIYAPRGRLTIPNLFYLQQLQTPDFNVWGSAIPGIPLLLAGTNGNVAWTLKPQADLDSRLIFSDVISGEIGEKHVLIPIAGSDTLVYSYLTSSDDFLIGIVPDSLTEKSVQIRIRWTGFKSSDEFSGNLALFRATDIDTIAGSFHDFKVPPVLLNLSARSGQFTTVPLGRPNAAESKNAVDSKREVLRHLLENLQAPIEPPDAPLLLHLLKNWDLHADSASVAATLFNVMSNILLRNIFIDEMGERGFRDFLQFPDLVSNALLKIFQTPTSVWIDDVRSTDREETLSELVQLSFTQTLDWLAEKNNRYLPASCWGNLTAFRLQPVLARGNARDWWLASERLDWRGNGFPENFVLFPDSTSEKFYGKPLFLRFELSDSTKIYWRLMSGQSGNPCSRNYRNQTKNWLSQTNTVEILTTENTNVFHRLILLPENQEN